MKFNNVVIYFSLLWSFFSILGVYSFWVIKMMEGHAGIGFKLLGGCIGFFLIVLLMSIFRVYWNCFRNGESIEKGKLSYNKFRENVYKGRFRWFASDVLFILFFSWLMTLAIKYESVFGIVVVTLCLIFLVDPIVKFLWKFCVITLHSVE